jgi:carbamoylphosphate synthase large subunit
MEYTEMIDKVKALAAQNRAAKTAEDKAEVRRQMDALKELDPKAFAVAVGYMAKTTEQKVKETDHGSEIWLA